LGLRFPGEAAFDATGRYIRCSQEIGGRIRLTENFVEVGAERQNPVMKKRTKPALIAFAGKEQT